MNFGGIKWKRVNKHFISANVLERGSNGARYCKYKVVEISHNNWQCQQFKGIINFTAVYEPIIDNGDIGVTLYPTCELAMRSLAYLGAQEVYGMA